ncbi:MAG: (2Fe-2S) ferredoxin domain-containing protein [Halothermotrichaceae bacterium]
MALITITVCIGSGCHVKGSRKIINILKEYINTNNLAIELELKACFCQNHCTEGVVVQFEQKLVTKITKDNIIKRLERYLLERGINDGGSNQDQ